ncbi:hypothetical protein [Metabacillus sediminilitoris]|uniref:hypothetical protein n=1 Tax=Metabacillus sediminilitoris TaxID=2567941 RepID=UPI0010A31542|nr:hypothetical protein [Metabacillus sediminilitoris]
MPKCALLFWENRLETFKIKYAKMERFGEHYLQFDVPHGLHLEMVERDEGEQNTWKFSGITSDVAIRGFAELSLFLLSHSKQ